MPKLKAYTVIEMLVVMLVSAVSIGITYTTYRIFSAQYISYKRNSEHISEYLVLDKVLTMDFLQAEKIHHTSEGIQLSDGEKELNYEFRETYVLRKHPLRTDTFKVNVISFERFTQEQVQHVPGTLIDRLTLESTYKEEKLNYVFNKHYGADVWMSLENEE